jgi:hypothetical protein
MDWWRVLGANLRVAALIAALRHANDYDLRGVDPNNVRGEMWRASMDVHRLVHGHGDRWWDA